MPQLNDLEVGQPLPGRTYTPRPTCLCSCTTRRFGIRIASTTTKTTPPTSSTTPAWSSTDRCKGTGLLRWSPTGSATTATLVEFEYSNRKASYLGQTLVSGGEIESVDSVNGRVRLKLFVKDEAGDVTSPGSAVVRLD